ncbi:MULTISPECIES: hypothetical protein [Paraburkholderia]|uniref:Uncharacterized protein n=1 Tax=Paraburkholderia podalyriae TaxID=1938811 RepID=A0ABR7PLA5_9BURK|nr:hypothetical protein [Paraburkholderia podalyriae]MBC8746931.1 hypothetical protein [Paraburkholderia podalyriae]
MKHAFAVLLLSLPALCLAEPGPYPPCGDEFPAYVAQMALRKTDILSLDFDATKTRAARLASEKIGKYEDGKPMWRGVYQITFEERNGNKIKVVAVYEIGELECTISDEQFLIVSKQLQLVRGDTRYRQIE